MTGANSDTVDTINNDTNNNDTNNNDINHAADRDIRNSVGDLTVNAAIAAIASESASLSDKIEMLIELAMGLQQKPKDVAQLQQSIALYQQAYDLCGQDYPLLRSRAQVGMGIASRSIPGEDAAFLLQSRDHLESALPTLREHAAPEEIAEAEMNLGLVLQSLVPFHQAKLADSIQAYQRALRVFTADTYPQEYAILQNNIAIAYLSMPLSMNSVGGEDLRQGMAVQTFEQALRSITLIDHPSEYAMLQNNLGNALQYAPSVHPVENNWRAVQAYDEALKVRNAQDTPLEYANTIANKANVLANLPDDANHPENGNVNHLHQAKDYYQEAIELFQKYGQLEQAQLVLSAFHELSLELEIAR